MWAEVWLSAVHCAPAGNLLASLDMRDSANKQTLLRQCMFVSSQMFLFPQAVRWLSGRGRSAACSAVADDVNQLQTGAARQWGQSHDCFAGGSSSSGGSKLYVCHPRLQKLQSSMCASSSGKLHTSQAISAGGIARAGSMVPSR